MFVDTHCHIHEFDYPLDRDEVIAHAHEAGVEQMICVGTSEKSSEEAIAFAAKHDGIFASIGVHPHDTKDGYDAIARLAQQKDGKLVAIGEIGLDYFYTHSPREAQTKALEAQIQLALDHDLPIILHVREAFDDFWPVFDNFHGIRGELHSFTDTKETLEMALGKGLYIGINGISTFARDKQEMFAAIPLDRMLLETDAPFLTPVPFRGRMNEPALVRYVAEFHAQKRGISLEEIATRTTTNARALFAL